MTFDDNPGLWGDSLVIQNELTQCAEEKSNESVEDMDGTFAGW